MTTGGPARRRRESRSANLSPQAQQTLDKVCEKHRKSVLREADRLAAARQYGGEQEPITASDMNDAHRLITKGYSADSGTWINTIGQVVSYVAAIVAGYFVNNIDKPWGSIGLVIVVLLGVAGFLMYTLVGRNR